MLVERVITTVLSLLFTVPCLAASKLNLALPKTAGLASFYGRREQGKRTANGERFDRMKYTAASRTYPMGTLLNVYYPRTHVTVTVRVNDAGPWVKGRILDLSERAATVLGLKGQGVGYVEISPVHLAQESL